MKKIIIYTSLSIVLMGCTHSDNKKEQDEIISQKKELIIKPPVTEDQLAIKKDPVCGMPAYKFLEDTTLFKDKIYGFCGKGCKEEFLKNPEKYSH